MLKAKHHYACSCVTVIKLQRNVDSFPSVSNLFTFSFMHHTYLLLKLRAYLKKNLVLHNEELSLEGTMARASL